MILPKQIWKNICEIEGFEEFIGYQISNTGRVKSIKGVYEKLISQTKSGGYLKITLHSKGKRKTVNIHRLVGLAFVPNDDKENKKELNHINEIKTDNRAENLEWCDREYNINYGSRIERMAKTRKEKTRKEKTHKNGTCNRPKKSNRGKRRRVRCVELDIVFDSITEASRFLGKGESGRINISACLRKIDNQEIAYGYHWEYIE